MQQGCADRACLVYWHWFVAQSSHSGPRSLDAAAADPGDVPFEDEAGIRHWLGSQGEKLSEDPNGHQYSWVEFYSEDLQKTYYYNQDTKVIPWPCMTSIRGPETLGATCAAEDTGQHCVLKLMAATCRARHKC